MRQLIRLGGILVLVGLLAGCQTVGGWFGRGSDIEVAPLVDFDSTVSVSRVWSANVGRGIDRSRPSLRPFHDGGEIWVADHRGQISVVDAESGQVLRRINTGMPISSGPAVYQDLVMFGTFDGELAVLDRESGEFKWRAQLSSEILSQPVMHDGVIIARCIDGRVFGLDRADGRRQWVHDRSVPLLTLRGNSDPLVRAGQVFIGYDDGMVTALRVADGSLLWEQRVSMPEGRTELDRLADIDGPMAIVGTELYVVTYRGRMASLALESGRILWVKEISSHAGVSVQRTQLASTDRNDGVWLVDRRNSTTLWRDDRLENRQITRPVFYGEYLVTADSEGYLHWYDLESGQFAARSRAGNNRPAAAPLVVGNLLYLLDENGTLTAWRAGSS